MMMTKKGPITEEKIGDEFFAKKGNIIDNLASKCRIPYDEILPVMLSVLLNYFIIKIMVGVIVRSSPLLQICLSILLLCHLFMWMCWLSPFGYPEDLEDVPKKKKEVKNNVR